MLLNFLSDLARSAHLLLDGKYRDLPSYTGLTQSHVLCVEEGNLEQVLRQVETEIRTLFDGQGMRLNYPGVVVHVEGLSPTQTKVGLVTPMQVTVKVNLGSDFPSNPEEYFGIVIDRPDGSKAKISNLTVKHHAEEATTSITFDAVFPEAGPYCFTLQPSQSSLFEPVVLDKAIQVNPQ
jgi:hypothetical protein